MSQDPYIRAANKFPEVKQQIVERLEKRKGQGKVNKPGKTKKGDPNV